MTRPKETSRENGRHSHGPKTQAGKDRSRFNAVRHGLLAQKIILVADEKAEAFEETLDAHVQRFHPQDEVEYCTVVEMVRAQWNLFRAFTAERQLFDQPGTAMAARFEPLIANRTLDLLPRYQAHLQLAYQRAIRTLILVRENFPLDSSQPDGKEPEQAAPKPTTTPQTTSPTPLHPVAAPEPANPEPAKPQPIQPPDDWPKVA